MAPQNGNANNFFFSYWIKIRIWGNCSPQRHLSCIEILGNIENVFFMKFTSQFNDPERGPPPCILGILSAPMKAAGPTASGG